MIRGRGMGWAGLLALLAGPPALAEGESPLELRRQQCVEWMMSAYPSGLEEVACTQQFALPSPFVFTCMAGLRRGFDDVRQRDACAVYLRRAAARAGEAYVRD